MEPATASRNDTGHRRIEIVHESLLTHWPRLVRWRTQDADGAQLRDQLRQAAHLWDERGRPDDLLWTGTSYLDYRAWRARYAGGLSALEEGSRSHDGPREPAKAPKAHRGRGGRSGIGHRSQRRRCAVDAQRGRAATGGRRGVQREASKLLALGQAELERYPTAALAYATKSLELADTEEARRLALRVAAGRPDRLRGAGTWSPPGCESAGVRHRQLARRGGTRGRATPPRGRKPAVGRASTRGNTVMSVFGRGPDGKRSSPTRAETSACCRFQTGARSARLKPEERASFSFVRGHSAVDMGDGGDTRHHPMGPARRRGAAAGGTMERRIRPPSWRSSGTSTRPWPELAYARGRNVYVGSLEDWSSPPRVVAARPADVLCVAFHPDGRTLAASDLSGGIGLATAARPRRPLRVLEATGYCRPASTAAQGSGSAPGLVPRTSSGSSTSPHRSRARPCGCAVAGSWLA